MSKSLEERLRRAIDRLWEARDASIGNAHQVTRLDGKIEGIRLAISYIEEERRIRDGIGGGSDG